MSTFLELVNAAILESGTDLDSVGVSEFTSPPKMMQERFKTWVQTAWKELQMERDDWEYKVGRASCFVFPSIYVENGNRATAPPVGAVYDGDDSGFTFEVKQVVTHSGAWASGTAKATIYFEITDEGSGDFKFNELFDETSPVAAANIFRCKGWGHFDFLADGQLTDFDIIHQNTLFIQTTGGSANQTNTSGVGLTPLVFVPFTEWELIEASAGGRGQPMYYTQTPDGQLDFWPRPDEEYVVHFTYTKTLETLTAYTDTPSSLPSEYHDAIMWRTLMLYGDYDNNLALERRAAKRFQFYKNKMEKRLMPVVTFGRSRYDE